MPLHCSHVTDDPVTGGHRGVSDKLEGREELGSRVLRPAKSKDSKLAPHPLIHAGVLLRLGSMKAEVILGHEAARTPVFCENQFNSNPTNTLRARSVCKA